MPNKEIARKSVDSAAIVLKVGDLTREEADAIVNAANTQLLAGGGVCGAIRRAAGSAPFEECQKILQYEGISSIHTGEARRSDPGDLETFGIKAIIHAVGPQGSGEDLLRSAYHNALQLAVNQGYTSIAFPSISTGIYGYRY